MKRVICSNVSNILPKLKSDIVQIVDQLFRQEFGWDEDDPSPYYVVEVTKYDHTYAKIEVRAEVDYEGLEDLDNALNQYVSKFDQDAYFEPVDPGITECYINYRKVAAALGDKIISSSSTITASSEYDQYMVTRLNRKQFSVHYTEIDNSPDADPVDMIQQFKFQVREIHPYDDAEYTWAKGGNGIIKYIRNGKEVDRTHYMTADDWEMDNGEWCDYIIRVAMEDLTELNKDVKPRMIHN